MIELNIFWSDDNLALCLPEKIHQLAVIVSQPAVN